MSSNAENFIKMVHMRAAHVKLVKAVGASPDNDSANVALKAWIDWVKVQDTTLLLNFTREVLTYLERIEQFEGVNASVVWAAFEASRSIRARIQAFQRRIECGPITIMIEA